MQDENTPKPGDEIKPWQPPTTKEKATEQPPSQPAPKPEVETTVPEPEPTPAPAAVNQPEPSLPEPVATQPAAETPKPETTPAETPSITPSTEESSDWAFTGDETVTDIEQIEPIETIEWSASEYIAHEKSPAWFAATASAAAVVAAIIYFITSQILPAITILVVAFAAMFFSARKPEIKNYKLSTRGLSVDGRHYSMSDFKSFSVVREGAIESIWLETLNKLTPTLRIYYSPEDGDAISNALAQFIPYSQRELDAVERASRRIRF